MPNEIGTVRQSSYGNWSEGTDHTARINRRGELVVMDFWTQLVIDGRMFHMQIGTEATSVASTTTMADTLVWMLVDNAAGTSILPALYEVALSTLTTATVPGMYLEIDRAKVRYSTGGTAFVPENMRTDRPRVSRAAAAYVGTDITAAAKTAVPGSIEIGHFQLMEDAITTGTGSEVKQYVLSARQLPLGMIVGVGSLLCHFGATTADVTGFGAVQWAELPSESVD
jgi:hypothetical protein